MSRYHCNLTLLVVLLFSSTLGVHTALQAQELIFSVPEIVSKNLPQYTKRVHRALATTGYQFNIVQLPAKRSIIMLSQGKVAIEILRNPSVAHKSPNVITIQPPVLYMTLQMLTASNTPEFCEVSENDFKTMSMAGVLGLEVLEHIYAPMFEQATIDLSSISDLVKFISLGRADVTFLPTKIINVIPDELKKQTTTCSSHKKNLPFNTHIHKDYLWAKKKIETAYRAEFGNNSASTEQRRQ